MSLLGLDMGTSACKAAVFDERGNLLTVASREYSARVPQGGWAEMDPDVMWNAAAEAVREASGGVSDRVEALAVSSQGETFIPVGADGSPVGPAIMNSDCRAAEQVRFLTEKVGKEHIYAVSGCVLHPMYALPKILWLKENEPEVYTRAAKFLSVGDHILSRLGVEPCTGHSLASRTMAFDVTRHEWSDGLLSAVEVEPVRFPEARPAGSVAGRIPRTVAAELNLKRGVIAAVGGHDQPCGALGAGVVDEGDIADSAGSYECLAAVSKAPVLSERSLSYSLNSYCHVVPDRYVTLAFFPGGVVLRWFRDQFAQPELQESASSGTDVYDLLARDLPDGPTGICFTPHFVGSGNPTWNADATGAIAGLTLDKTRRHLFKSILEGIGCELRINLRVLEELLGPADILRTTGGGARSDYWLQLRADITGRQVASLRGQEAACLGAAVLAGVGAGVYSDARQGAGEVAAVARIYWPDPGRGADYADQIARYERLYPALAEAGVYS